jgi:hypothetical protein
MDVLPAAQLIQRIYRGHRTRRKVKEWNKSATKIQAIYRGYHARQSFRKRLSIATQQQSLDLKMNQAQAHIQYLEKELKELSLANRTRMRIWANERRERAARCIQKHLRGYIARKKYQSRPASPLKDISLSDPIPFVKNVNYWTSTEEEEEALKDVTDTIIKRIYRDQFDQELLLGMHGETFKELSMLRAEQFQTKSALANAIVSKLQSVQELLDGYYGEASKLDNTKGVESSRLLTECDQLRHETNEYIDFIQKGILYRF